jgi:hypothetical protein
MAKLIFNDDHLVEIEIEKPDKGDVCVISHPDDRNLAAAAITGAGLKVWTTVSAKLIAATCDIVITTADIKHLIDHPGEPILLNGGPFGIYLSLTKTPMDFLEENPITPQGTSL